MTDTESGPEASLPVQEILQNKVELLESALPAQYTEEISLSRQLVEYNVLLNDTFQVYNICLPTEVITQRDLFYILTINLDLWFLLHIQLQYT